MDRLGVAAALFDEDAAESAAWLQDASPVRWHRPGLLSFWVDDEGRADLERALGLPLDGRLLAWTNTSAEREAEDAVRNTLWGEVALRVLDRSRFSWFRWRVGEVVMPKAGGAFRPLMVPWLEQHLYALGLPLDAATAAELVDVLEPAVPALFRAGNEPTAVQGRLQQLTDGRRTERKARAERRAVVMAEGRARLEAARLRAARRE